MKPKTLARLFPGLGRELTERENWAVTWAKQNHGWRKKYSESWKDYMERGKAQNAIRFDLWMEWYSRPYGDPTFNENVQIVRGLFREVAERKAVKSRITNEDRAFVRRGVSVETVIRRCNAFHKKRGELIR